MKKSDSLRLFVLAACVLLQWDEAAIHARGAAGDLDLSFNASLGITGSVKAVAMQLDGKILVGGAGTFVNGTNRYGSFRLNTNGATDETFTAASFNPSVGDLGIPHDPAEFYFTTVFGAFAVQPDGKVLAAGVATRWDCTSDAGCIYSAEFYFVTRHYADGSRDASFAPALGNSLYGGGESVRTIAAQPDGKVVLLGNFQAVNGTNRNGLARLNANGSLDLSFNPGFGVVRTIGDPQYNIQEIDYATTVTTLPDGKLLFGVRSEYSQCDVFEGGCFFSTTYSVVRLNADGSKDSAFVFTNLVNGLARFGWIRSIAVQPDGKLVVASDPYNNVRIGRLNADGDWDDSFTRNTMLNGTVDAVAFQPDGKLLIAGAFTKVNEIDRNRVARLNADGSFDAGFDPEPALSPAPSMLALQPDGKLLIGGPIVVGDPWFGPATDSPAFVNGANFNGRMRLNYNGRVDRAFTSATFNPPLSAMYHLEDCIGDPRFGCSQGAAATALLPQPDGKVVIGGYSVSTITGDEILVQVYHPFVARFASGGGLESRFDQLTNAYEINALALQPGGKILVGGWFYRPDYNYGLTRLHGDGSVDNAFDLGAASVNGIVRSIATQPDGKILIGGYFSSVSGANRKGIARLNADGTLDNTFNPGSGADGAVRSMALQPDGKLLIGGSFTTVNGTNRNRIARLNPDGSLDAGFNPGTGADGAVHAIALQPDGKVLIAGDFNTVNGIPRQYVARLQGDFDAPALHITRSGGFATVSWPLATPNFQLQASTNLGLANAWLPVTQSPVTNGAQISVTVPISTGRKFFRLQSP